MVEKIMNLFVGCVMEGFMIFCQKNNSMSFSGENEFTIKRDVN